VGVSRPSPTQQQKKDALTGPVILGTFRTPEGFAVIKSELVDRISIQNPRLYRQDAEKIVNTIFSEIAAVFSLRFPG
jgi:hypothetical protein